MSKNNVAIYISDRFTEEISLENQIQQCAEYANKSHYNIVRIYLDSRNINHPKDIFGKILEDIKSNHFESILVYSHKIFDYGLYEYILNIKGISVKSVTESYDDLMENPIYRAMNECKVDLNDMILDGFVTLNI